MVEAHLNPRLGLVFALKLLIDVNYELAYFLCVRFIIIYVE